MFQLRRSSGVVNEILLVDRRRELIFCSSFIFQLRFGFYINLYFTAGNSSPNENLLVLSLRWRLKPASVG
jgi:hypothetical protein